MEIPKSLEAIFEQVTKMQDGVGKVQAELEQREFEGSAGGGMVTVKMNGTQIISSLKIDPQVVNPQDVDMLQDLIRAAINEASRKARDTMRQEIGKLTGGLPIPGFS